MNLNCSLSGRAETDLTNQYRWYLDNATPAVAERFLAAFDETLSQLSHLPTLGRPRRFRSPELRGIRSLRLSQGFEALLVFYRSSDTGISIERVMHGARDLERRLIEPPEECPMERVGWGAHS